MTVLIIAEHDNKSLKASTLNTISAGLQLENELHVLVIGSACQDVAAEVATLQGVSQVLCADLPCYEHQLAENCCELMHSIAKDYHYILAPGSTFGKNCMPRLAGLLGVSQVSDIIKIIDKETFIRPIYAGNALATVKSSEPIKIITVRSTAFEPAQPDDTIADIKQWDNPIENTLSEFVQHELNVSERPELTTARVVISGGRGLKSKENFQLLESLADKLNGAIGASRAAVDAGFVPNDYQVGQTGKVVAPELYIAVGISGAIQHLAGMKDSKVIVAINKDPDAPIFKIADYGLVGDLFEIIPQLEKKLGGVTK